jgi:Tol biopolymer transport system component
MPPPLPLLLPLLVRVVLGLVLGLLPGSATSSSRAGGLIVYASIPGIGLAGPGNPDAYGDLFSVRPDGTGVRRLTRTSLWEQDPAWSPNRQLIAFSRGGTYCHATTMCDYVALGISVMAADGTQQRALTTNSEVERYVDSSPSWSPDSRSLAFIRGDNIDGADPLNGIYVIGADGEGLERISREKEAISLAWSPTGSTIAYAHQTERAQYVGLLDLATGQAKRLLTRGFRWPNSVAWSNQGRFLAVAASDGLYIVRTTGGTGRKVAATRGADGVSWSPNGCCLVFSAVPKGVPLIEPWPRSELYVVSVRGGTPRRLTRSRGPDFQPAWRP